ncbi:ABC transporter permease [Nocardia sp. NEAU-351]|uniref:ABC transporter permease n=2 Tax=Nocardia bovistercoris TaxID=2785916 RepID=A0A931IE22_9NOCA|nr:ABC transporter permease [Nocardia bovistercoris]
MSPTTAAIRAGGVRAAIELRQTFSNAQDLVNQFSTPIVLLVALFFMRDASFRGGEYTLGALALPGVIGSVIAFNGVFAIAQFLVLDREDGTLLRAKAVPNGMVGYFIGKIGTSAGTVLVQVVVLLGFGMPIVGGLSLTDAASWATLLWVLALGLLATLPLGAILGATLSDSRATFFLTIPLMGLIAISGIYYPVTGLPGWLQAVAQVFPMYWLGLGMRSAMLPPEAVVVELEQSWRHAETAAVLGVWAVVGLALAPAILRRMARRESGVGMDARREKALKRVY